MKKLRTFFSRHRRLGIALIFLYFAILSGCIFPAYNLTRPESNYGPWSHLFLAASIAVFWGGMVRGMLPNSGLLPVLALNFGVPVAGMVFRFLLEFGEVSNTYNFTLPNMALHIAIAVIVSTLTWYWRKQDQ